MKSIIKKEPVLMVGIFLAVVSMFFVHPSKEYASYIDYKTLGCLFCLMASLKGFERQGILGLISTGIMSYIKNTRMIAYFLVFTCYFIAMVMTNDVALIAIVPITLSILSSCNMQKWSIQIIVLQTIAANIGSSLTPIGNPQNLFLFTHYDMKLLDFFATMIPIVLVGGILLAVGCLVVPSKKIESVNYKEAHTINNSLVIIYSILFLLAVGSVFGAVPYWIVLLIVVLIVFFVDKQTLIKVDYSLLLTFIVIFIFVGNIGKIEPIYNFLSEVTKENTMLSGILTSQVTSNVPAAILLSGFTQKAKDLLLGVNIGGMGTLIASMASVISYKLYIGESKGQTLRYLKVFTLWNILFLVVLTVCGALL